MRLVGERQTNDHFLADLPGFPPLICSRIGGAISMNEAQPVSLPSVDQTDPTKNPFSVFLLLLLKKGGGGFGHRQLRFRRLFSVLLGQDSRGIYLLMAVSCSVQS